MQRFISPVSSQDQDKAKPAIARLASVWPALFSTPTPLAAGVHLALLAAPDASLSRTAIRRALEAWCRHPLYLAQLVEGAPRLGLDGSPIGVVTADEAASASRLQRRRAKRAEAAAPPKPKASLADLKAAAQARRAAETWHRYVPIERIAAFESLGWIIAPGGPLHAPHGFHAVIMDWAGDGPPTEPQTAGEIGGSL